MENSGLLCGMEIFQLDTEGSGENGRRLSLMRLRIVKVKDVEW